jgi:hypothetical protein
MPDAVAPRSVLQDRPSASDLGVGVIDPQERIDVLLAHLGPRGPRLRGSKPASPPASCCLRHAVKCDVYKPSRRSIDAISPGRVALAASRKIRNLYEAVNFRRFARSASSGSGRDPSPAATRAPSISFRSPTASSTKRSAPGVPSISTACMGSNIATAPFSPSRLSNPTERSVSPHLGREG